MHTYCIGICKYMDTQRNRQPDSCKQTKYTLKLFVCFVWATNSCYFQRFMLISTYTHNRTSTNIIVTECRLIYMHNTTSTPLLFVNIRVVWSQKRYNLTSNCVLHNSKWEHSPICQYCFKPTSPIPFLPVQFKGKERGRWVQLVEISQNKLSDSTVLC